YPIAPAGLPPLTQAVKLTNADFGLPAFAAGRYSPCRRNSTGPLMGTRKRGDADEGANLDGAKCGERGVAGGDGRHAAGAAGASADPGRAAADGKAGHHTGARGFSTGG